LVGCGANNQIREWKCCLELHSRTLIINRVLWCPFLQVYLDHIFLQTEPIILNFCYVFIVLYGCISVYLDSFLLRLMGMPRVRTDIMPRCPRGSDGHPSMRYPAMHGCSRPLHQVLHYIVCLCTQGCSRCPPLCLYTLIRGFCV
jgi:hypothetical protein